MSVPLNRDTLWSATQSVTIKHPRCEHTDGRGRCRTDGAFIFVDFRSNTTAPQWLCQRHVEQQRDAA